tara:strand:+ start:73 stop:474 length:402 start_codon:yes stop_codon:yes gene_type:complete
MSDLIMEIVKGQSVTLHKGEESIILTKKQIKMLAEKVGAKRGPYKKRAVSKPVEVKRKGGRPKNIKGWPSLNHLVASDVDDIISMYKAGGTSQRELGELYGISQKYVGNMIHEPRDYTLSKIGASLTTTNGVG